jgi:hypothetical protein
MTVFDLGKHEPIAFCPWLMVPDVIKFDPGLQQFTKPVTAALFLRLAGAIRTMSAKNRGLQSSPRGAYSRGGSRSRPGVPTEQEENGKPVARMVVYEAATGR